MAVDAKRVQAVFLTAVEAADPVHRSAILDRECGSDTAMRQLVEALLRAHRGPAGIHDQPGGSPREAPPPASDFTVVLARPATPEERAVALPRQEPPAAPAAPEEDGGPASLDFLQP